MLCQKLRSLLKNKILHATMPFTYHVTRRSYKISQEILILLYKWISPLPDKDSDCTSLGFIIITSLFAWAIWFAVKNTLLSGRPRVCLSPQFPVTISRKGLICLPFLKPVLLRQWYVRLLELTINGGVVYKFTPLRALPHAIVVKPTNCWNAGIEPTYERIWTSPRSQPATSHIATF